MHVLLVEDDRTIATYVKRGLEEHGYAVDLAANGREALDWLAGSSFDLIVLDIMLPGVDGLAVCRNLRAQGITTPVLMLTARGTIDDRVDGLDAGADDYLTKPFAMPELLARLRALSRRTGSQPGMPQLSYGDLVLDQRSHTVARGGREIDLTAKEFAVLECLMRSPGAIFSRGMIADQVWNYDTFHESNVVDVYISNLRRKIDDQHSVKLIQTVRGLGYRIAADERDATTV